MDGLNQKSPWIGYWRNVRALGLVLGFLFVLALINAAFTVPLPELAHRAVVVAALYIGVTFGGAGLLFLIPRLWAWPWMRKGDPGGHRMRAHAFVTEMERASPTERAQLSEKYQLWIRAGASAQSWRTPAAAVIIAIAVVFAFVANGHALRYLVYAGCLLAVLGAAWLLRDSFRRESAWREANPFDTWRHTV